MEIEKTDERGETVSISIAILELRTAENISQQELADRLFVSRELVSKWETGQRRPDFRTISQIAEIFHVPVKRIVDPDDLVFRELSGCMPKGGVLSEEQLPALLNRFLRGLPERESGVFLNRYYSLKSTSEIAAQYGIGENHVRSMLSKTRKKLKRILKEEFS